MRWLGLVAWLAVTSLAGCSPSAPAPRSGDAGGGGGTCAAS